MRLTKSQIAQLSKWANGGRLIVRPIMPPENVPAWAKHEFVLARAIVTLVMEYANSGELERKTRARAKRYAAGNRKGWVSRKRQAAARSQPEAVEMGEVKAA